LKRIIYLIILLFFINCSDKNKSESLNRNAFIYFSENPKEEIFDFKIIEKKDFAIYKYVSQVDSSKIVDLNFTNKNQMFFGEEFIQEKRNPISFQEIPDINFHFYEMKDPVIDGTGPILFNNQYGILGIYNGFGPRIIFLKNSDKELSLKVLKALQE
tara:strand:- start:137 stop:607 length:471 start_codon:yes stop_codon:yes gene_type:complete